MPQGEKIPAKKLDKAAHSDNPTLAKRARLAETLKGLHRAEGGAIPPRRRAETELNRVSQFGTNAEKAETRKRVRDRFGAELTGNQEPPA